jgi:hypothetical protein
MQELERWVKARAAFIKKDIEFVLPEDLKKSKDTKKQTEYMCDYFTESLSELAEAETELFKTGKTLFGV